MASYASATTDSYNYQPDPSYEPEVQEVIRRDELSIDYISKYDGNQVKQYEIVKELVKLGIPSSKIFTVLKLKPGHFSVRFKKEDPIKNKCPQILTIGDKVFVKEIARNFELRIYHNSRHVKLFNFPGECDLEWIRPAFQKYGAVKRAYRSYLREYPTIENGTVTIVMNRGALVPKVVWVKGNRFKTWYIGQEDDWREKSKCFRCSLWGHYSYECTTNLSGAVCSEQERSDDESDQEDEDVGLGVNKLLDSAEKCQHSAESNGSELIQEEDCVVVSESDKKAESDAAGDCQEEEVDLSTPLVIDDSAGIEVEADAAEMKRKSNAVSPPEDNNCDNMKPPSKKPARRELINAAAAASASNQVKSGKHIGERPRADVKKKEKLSVLRDRGSASVSFPTSGTGRGRDQRAGSHESTSTESQARSRPLAGQADPGGPEDITPVIDRQNRCK
jgi:hypothetical protein